MSNEVLNNALQKLLNECVNTYASAKGSAKMCIRDRFMLRCIQCGISISDLEYLTIGMVNDMFIELKNDDYKYPLIATQADIDRL